jgi:autotransporter translocation and assembly factor TamB
LGEETIQSYLLTGRGPDSGEHLLNVGTQLRDDLYVGYGIDLLEGTHEFNLRYDILRWLGLEADVGEADNAVNFSYQLER